FTVHILSRFHRGNDVRFMVVVRRGDDYGVNAGQREDFTMVPVSFGAPAGAFNRAFDAAFVSIADRDDFDAGDLLESFDQSVRTRADADETERHAIVRGVILRRDSFSTGQISGIQRQADCGAAGGAAFDEFTA